MIKFYIFLIGIFFIISNVHGQYPGDKIISPNGTINAQCLDLIRGTNKNLTRLQSCDAFKCFENRFPCGKRHWIMNWGYKYCVRYSDPEYLKKFTEKGKIMLEYLKECLPKFLEKHYKSNKSMNCNRLSLLAFKAQGKCYSDILEIFCVAFPENKDLFIKVLDKSDFLNFDSINMISKVADKCNPKLDLSSFIFSSG